MNMYEEITVILVTIKQSVQVSITESKFEFPGKGNANDPISIIINF